MMSVFAWWDGQAFALAIAAEDSGMANSLFDEPNDVQSPNGDSAVPLRELPRLRILHLLIITAVAAVILSISRFVIPVERVLDRDQANVVALSLLSLLIFSIGLSCFGFQLRWWWKGLPAFRQPGQWLMIVFPALIATGLAMLAAMFTLERISEFGSRGFMTWMQVFGLVTNICTTLFYAYATFRIADTSPWQLYFGWATLKALARLVTFLDQLLFGAVLTTSLFRNFASSPSAILALNLTVAGLNIALLSGAAIGDLPRRDRHWSHWMGVALFVLWDVISVTATATVMARLP
jgi:hypothetical protein